MALWNFAGWWEQRPFDYARGDAQWESFALSGEILETPYLKQMANTL